MNVFHKVTLQSLRQNKARTIVTIIGIMLSAALICAVTTFVSSMQNYILANMIYQHGSWHGSALNAEYSVRESIRGSDEIAQAVYAQNVGYASLTGLKDGTKPYLYVLGASAGFEDMMPIHITDGRYPETADEILLPNHLSEIGGISHATGDTLQLALGERMLDGFALYQFNPFIPRDSDSSAETLQVRETRTYTVVGFYERPKFENYDAPGFTAITVADEDAQADYFYDVYFKMKNPKDVYAFMRDNQLSGSTNTNVLTYSGIFQYDGLSMTLVRLAIIFIVLIVFGSVALIYNAFSISVSERTRQFGLLSSVGATRKQLRKTVYFEALTVSAIGIPLGILVGIGGIGVTLLLIGHKFALFSGFDMPLRLCVSVEAIVIAVLIALITVLISAWIPARRATRISAVDAIRQTVDIQAGSKPVRTSKLTYRLFGLPGVLANKYYKRSRKKYRATVISLFMSIVLFIAAASFTDYLVEAAEGSLSTDGYDIMYYYDQETEQSEIEADRLLELLRNNPGITGACYAQTQFPTVQIDLKYLDERFLKLQPEIAEKSPAEVSAFLTFVNDAEFKNLLRAHNLDERVYMNAQEPLAIAVDGYTVFDREQEKFVAVNTLKSDTCEASLLLLKKLAGYYLYAQIEDETEGMVLRYMASDGSGDMIDMSVEDASEKITIRSAKTIYERPYFLSNAHLAFVYPNSLKSALLTGNEIDQAYRYYFTSDDPAASYAAIRQTLNENGLGNSSLINYAEQADTTRNIISVIKVFAYGFIILISLIAAANVFNTISTNIGLRRRDLAMLKSVGMTEKGFRKMMNFECLLYGAKALLYGLPVSAAISFLIYSAVSEGYSTGFRLPWVSIGIAVLSVFAVVFATMLYAMHKVRKENPIDALRSETF